MTMAKPDYDIIADALNEAFKNSPTLQMRIGVLNSIECISVKLSMQFPNFDQGKFFDRVYQIVTVK